ncbi:homoserine kinase [Alphaproteobacteria bacterium]|nr:homoserine kinase [Alphaproteobacteria bacterium]
MAVFTKLEKNEIEIFLKNYSVGNLLSYEGIIEGIENTNYKIITSNNSYILTIFEKRVNPKELPFFMNLQKNLVSHGFECPLPVENNNGSVINVIKDKFAVITSFLKGNKLSSTLPIHCREVGSMIAKFTNITKSSKLKRENTLNLKIWENILKKCKKTNNKSYHKYFEILQKELFFLKRNWPTNLPKAIIHADLFQDNIFFIEDKISGVIDFYFSCEDYIAYEIALAVNAWCFDLKDGFRPNNYLSLMEGFNEYSSINNEEIKSLNILLRGAAVRILVTRLHDTIYHPENALVVPKDPDEYLKILKWHQKNTKIDL